MLGDCITYREPIGLNPEIRRLARKIVPQLYLVGGIILLCPIIFKNRGQSTAFSASAESRYCRRRRTLQ
jgi:dienelactone hydrolase